MPQVVTFDKMNVGRKGTGKHWTKEEIKKREAAAQKLQRPKPVKLKIPKWLDDVARQVWKKTLKDMAGIELLDKLDEEVLAIYCDAVARYREATLKVREEGYITSNAQGTETVNPYVKAAQSYAKIMIQYADKLGLNPNSRARLAKKRENEPEDPNKELFD